MPTRRGPLRIFPKKLLGSDSLPGAGLVVGDDHFDLAVVGLGGVLERDAITFVGHPDREVALLGVGELAAVAGELHGVAVEAYGGQFAERRDEAGLAVDLDVDLP